MFSTYFVETVACYLILSWNGCSFAYLGVVISHPLLEVNVQFTAVIISLGQILVNASSIEGMPVAVAFATSLSEPELSSHRHCLGAWARVVRVPRQPALPFGDMPCAQQGSFLAPAPAQNTSVSKPLFLGRAQLHSERAIASRSSRAMSSCCRESLQEPASALLEQRLGDAPVPVANSRKPVVCETSRVSPFY